MVAQLLRQSLALLERPELADQDTRREKAFVLKRMGDVASSSDFEEEQRLRKQSLALYQALGDRWGMANALEALRWVVESLGVYGEAPSAGRSKGNCTFAFEPELHRSVPGAA